MLFRASHHSAALEIELARRNIPFVKFGGLKFLEAAHVKDVLAFLRWAENPRDRVAGFRVLQLMPGVGPGDRGALLDHVADAADVPHALAGFAPPPAPPRRLAVVLRRCCATGARRRRGWPAELDRVRRWYEPHLERIYDDAAMRAGRPRPARRRSPPATPRASAS